jgi:hypothetical protein
MQAIQSRSPTTKGIVSPPATQSLNGATKQSELRAISGLPAHRHLLVFSLICAPCSLPGSTQVQLIRDVTKYFAQMIANLYGIH